MVAICDVDENKLERRRPARFPKAKRFTDFRKMLDEMGKSIDAVTVSTPDHIHAPAALMAMRMGKHCFCQKPLTHTIYEARLLGQVARREEGGHADGQPGHGRHRLRKAAAVVKAGRAGHGQGGPRLDEPADLAARRPAARAGKPPGAPEWDLWLGPAPERPYANGYHPFAWRGWWDFGTGALGDMACHTVNMPFMALDLRDPIAVQAETSGHNKDSYPKWSMITFEFPATGDRPAVKMFWYDGGKRPAHGLFEGKDRWRPAARWWSATRASSIAPATTANGLRLLGDVDDARSDNSSNRPATSTNGSAPSRAASRPCRTSPTTPAP